VFCESILCPKSAAAVPGHCPAPGPPLNSGLCALGKAGITGVQWNGRVEASSGVQEARKSCLPCPADSGLWRLSFWLPYFFTSTFCR
jgi:hypothetical protein